MKSKTYLLEIYSIVYMFLLSFISLFLSSVLLRNKDAGIEEVSMSLDEEFDEDAWEEEWQS